jgi:predicted membrane GTPase involved in stress response
LHYVWRADGDVTFREGALEVQGRGELQLAVLVENMRREGFELSLSPPKVLFQTQEDGSILEPIEEVRYATISLVQNYLC